MPVDISGEHLVAAARQLAADYPRFPIVPVIADYTRSFELPLSGPLAAAKRVVFFPGSTIGNLDRAEAGTFLRRMTTLVRRGGGVIVGVDLKKDKARRSEEHTSELQSLMRISYAVFCLKKKKQERETHETSVIRKNE